MKLNFPQIGFWQTGADEICATQVCILQHNSSDLCQRGFRARRQGCWWYDWVLDVDVKGALALR